MDGDTSYSNGRDTGVGVWGWDNEGESGLWLEQVK